ncbi:MAG: LysM peptidoglycan-binding domain-containing protein [Myxococcota bacterium]|nr:LysM peptidoglycan-binding domain-containing protein [Myxococcota bacterium]
MERRKRRWRDALRHLASGKAPSDERQHHAAQTLEAALGHAPSTREYARASRRIRFQLGQRDEFRAGLIRAGAFDAAIREVLLEEGVPEGLIALPYVESSFNLSAYSKYGAAGPWQFMRSTGRRFLKIDYVVDERLDAIIATRAAARLLRKNHNSLESWPLAITAYNHGRAGMARAVRRLGTRDIDRIIEKYRSRSFGFASRNFYVQFLAASEILQSHESYFGPLVRDKPTTVDRVKLPFYAALADLEELGVSPEAVKRLNPSLRPPVFRGMKRIPRNFELKLPAGSVGTDTEAWLAQVPETRRYTSQTKSRYYRVRAGDTLGRIARRNSTSVSALVAQNGLRNRHRIRKGQVLEIPGPGQKAKPPSRRTAKTARDRIAERGPRPVAAPTQKIAALAPEPEFLGPWRTLQPISGNAHWHRLRGNSTHVGPLETLGHLADWLGVSSQRLRNLNHLDRRDLLRLGQRIELDFSRTPEEIFRQRRLEYHKGIEEDFFESFVITGTIEHRLQVGDNLWELSRQTYSVPIWLLQRYNPELDLSELVPGRKLSVPVIAPTGRIS